ncbi:unnamed protein product [Closterium sp. NIES-54]
MPARELNSVRKLSTLGVTQATEAALRSVWQPTRLPTSTAGAKNVSAGTSTPTPPTPSVPLTKLLGRRGLTRARVLLALATTKASTLRGCTSTSTSAAATSATAAAASTTAAAADASTTAAAASTTSTAATEAPTPGTTPTSTTTPSASSTASTAAPATPSTTLAPLALAGAAPPTRGRHSSDLLSANEVDSSSKSNRGEKGDRGTPLRERVDLFLEGSSGRGGVARNNSVVQRLGSLVLAKVRALSRREVTTNSKASNSVTSGSLRANRAVSSGRRCGRDTGRVIEKGDPIPRVTLKKELFSYLAGSLLGPILTKGPPSRRRRAAAERPPPGAELPPPSRRRAAAAEPPPSRSRAAAAEPPPSRRRAAAKPLPPSSRRRSAVAEPPLLSCRRATTAEQLPLSRRSCASVPASAPRPSPPVLTSAVMATPSVLTFDAEGRAVDFEVWVDDLQLFLQCDRADGLSLFDLTSGASPAPPATAESTVRSQWATHDAAARLAVRRHLPTTERAHFSQYRSAQTLYDAVVARYSSPATASRKSSPTAPSSPWAPL